MFGWARRWGTSAGKNGHRAIDDEITLPVLVDESSPRRLVRRACVIASIAILALSAWTFFARLNEVAEARGVITPSGYERIVQHFEGGIVDQILVRAGDTVNEGTPILQLADAGTLEDVAVLKRQGIALAAQVEALRALIDSREPDFAVIGDADSPEIVAARNAFVAERAANADQRRRLNDLIDQAKSALSAIDTQLQGLRVDLVYVSEMRDRSRYLLSKGYTTESAYAEKARLFASVESNIAVQEERRRGAAAKIAESEQALNAYITEARAGWSTRLRDLQTSMTATGGEADKKERRRQRLTVTSPVNGVIKSLDVTTLGGVVEPGKRIATIVPIDETLQVEAYVPASQIGYVAVGQPAQVKVSAYDFTRYGWLDGEVKSISPSSFQDPTQGMNFRVQIALAQTRLPRAASAQIVPGMEVKADIVTGEKTVIGWLLRPIRRTLSESFGEK